MGVGVWGESQGRERRTLGWDLGSDGMSWSDGHLWGYTSSVKTALVLQQTWVGDILRTIADSEPSTPLLPAERLWDTNTGSVPA